MKQYTPPSVDYAKTRASRTIPDQSLSIQEIVKRYVKGVPVDVTKREAVFVDQNEHDLEKLSRMDFGEKAEYARMLAEQAQRLANDLNEYQAQRKASEESKLKAAQAEQKTDAQKEPTK